MTQLTKAPRTNINIMTQAQYDAAIKNPNELYVITDTEYLDEIVFQDVVDALGYVPYSSTNPDGYITGITTSDVINALGYTPENEANKTITIDEASTDVQYPSAKAVYDAIQGSSGSSSLADLSDVDISSPSQGENLTYDAVTGKWQNTSSSATVGWGGITGVLSDQTDLQDALNEKTTKFSVMNPALTSIDGKCTWTIINNIGSQKVQVSIYNTSTYKEVIGEVISSDSTIQVELISDSDIGAETYEAIIVG